MQVFQTQKYVTLSLPRLKTSSGTLPTVTLSRNIVTLSNAEGSI
jgi:hypothetical protein